MPTFEIGEIIFPLVSGKYTKANTVKVGRFLGTGFYISSNGLFITCKHVIEALEQRQDLFLGKVYGLFPGNYLPITNIKVHPKFDFACGQVITKKRTKVLKPYRGPFALGLEVGAFGYSDAGKEKGCLFLDRRYLKGHISRISHEPYDFPAKSLCEVSFSVPSGFSGTALLSDDYQLVGMLYGNIESRLQAYSISEVIEGNSTFQEKAYRVTEFGLAHTIGYRQVFYANILKGAILNGFHGY